MQDITFGAINHNVSRTRSESLSLVTGEVLNEPGGTSVATDLSAYVNIIRK